jgi:hypothetical protein
MRNVIIATGMIFVMNVKADIEYSADNQSKATFQEIDKNRSCFQELKLQGCGDPGDDLQQFRSCLNNVYSSLNTDCKKMMSELYGKK